jgi:hypothetical protein
VLLLYAGARPLVVHYDSGCDRTGESGDSGRRYNGDRKPVGVECGGQAFADALDAD